MLVLTRRPNESLVIGDGITCPLITITFVSIVGDKVKVGIVARCDVPVYRGEIAPPTDHNNQPST